MAVATAHGLLSRRLVQCVTRCGDGIVWSIVNREIHSPTLDKLVAFEYIYCKRRYGG
jgi:hypothetical protein